MSRSLQPFDQITTLTGRPGIVRSLSGRVAQVLFADGTSGSVDVDDLVLAPAGADEALLEGQLGDPDLFGLRLQALFLKHAYRFDPQTGLSNARVEPNLHQVYIAHQVTNKLQPRMILADEVGLGKTIEAGLVLKELRARGMIERVLVVCPASLQYQWQTELRSKFNEEFEIINAAGAKYLGQGGRNPFEQRDSIICSLPFASYPTRAEQVVDAPWDLVIFDEAHRVRRWRQGNSAKGIKTTQAYRLADDLKDLTSGLLLLTATPMQLHHFELYSLIELVEPGLYPNFDGYEKRRRQMPILNQLMRVLKGWPVLSVDERREAVVEHAVLLAELLGDRPVSVLENDEQRSGIMDALVEKHPLAGVMVRNRKAELGGFTKRTATRHLVELSEEELELYNDITDYIRTGYDRAKAQRQTAVGFLMVGYQKMLASSPHAIRESFKRRVDRLTKSLTGQNATKKKGKPKSKALLTSLALEELADADDLSAALDAVESDSLGEYERAAIETEIAELQVLIDRLARIADPKAEKLLDALEKIFDHDPKEKVVIFTQSKDTQKSLRLTLEDAGLAVSVFNGSLNVDEKEDAVRRFKESGQILISTESGGEGRNLQFAHLLVNYDLPWNPMKVEQRIGRLDRIGQRREVFIYNLACKGTVEERVLDVLDNRIQLFTESVGSLDPILGEVEEDITELVMSQLDNFEERFEEMARDLDQRTREARENERLLADLVLDRASLRRDRANELLGHESLASHKDLAEFVGRSLDYFGGSLKPHIDGGHTITLSPKLSTRLRMRGSQHRGVFDPAEALAHEELDFLAVGHDLVDGIVELPLRDEVVLAAARRVPDLPGPGPYLELWYQIRSEGPISFGRVVRHLVDESLMVEASEVNAVPDVGKVAERVEVPQWAKDAVAASRAHFDEVGRPAGAAEVVERYQARQAEELARAERIFAYRRARLQHLIAEGRGWVEEKERTGSDRDRRVLPARRGKVAKDVERLESLQFEYNQQVAEVKAGRGEVVGTLWAVSVVIPL